MTMADSFWDMGSAWEDDGVMFLQDDDGDVL
jgi:hypothetical protein